MFIFSLFSVFMIKNNSFPERRDKQNPTEIYALYRNLWLSEKLSTVLRTLSFTCLLEMINCFQKVICMSDKPRAFSHSCSLSLISGSYVAPRFWRPSGFLLGMEINKFSLLSILFLEFRYFSQPLAKHWWVLLPTRTAQWWVSIF